MVEPLGMAFGPLVPMLSHAASCCVYSCVYMVAYTYLWDCFGGVVQGMSQWVYSSFSTNHQYLSVVAYLASRAFGILRAHKESVQGL